MASILLTVAGAAVGNALLPGIGGALLGGVAGMVGGTIDRALFGQSVIKGPRLDNLKVQDSSYGNGIPLMYGTVRVSGNVIWASDIIETLSNESAGGKGFGGTEVERASYSVDVGIALGYGPIGSIATIWADGKEVYANGSWIDGTLWDAEFYIGDAAQDPSPLMESELGAGNVPAYRGLAYVVLHRLQLGNFGNRIPNFTFEVHAVANSSAPLWLGEVNPGLQDTPSSIHTPGGMPPVITAWRGGKATNIVVGGTKPGGGQYAFAAVEYDISGKSPVEISRVNSAYTALGSISLQAITMKASPSGKKIAFMMDFGSATIAIAVYDTEARVFGPMLIDNYSTYETARQIGWLDEQRFVIADKVGTSSRGVRVYAVAGLSATFVNFFDLWGLANGIFRIPLPSASYATMPGGLYVIAGNTVNTPTSLWGRAIRWQDNTLQIGTETLLTNVADGINPQRTSILTMNNGEVVFVRNFSGTIYLLSFIPRFDGATITRPLTSLSVVPGGEMIVNGDGEKIFFMHQELTITQFRYGEIGLTPTGFSLSQPSTLIMGSSTSSVSFFLGTGVGRLRIFVIVGNISGAMFKAALFETGKSAQSLGSVAADLLARAGYASSDYDLADLNETLVEGYTISDPTAVRAAIEPLQEAYGFDLVESDALLKARPYGITPDAVLNDAETRAVEEGKDMSPRSVTLRAQELDLPRELIVTHIDPELDYQKGSQRARRAGGVARTVQNLTVPLVLSADEAVQLAEVQLFRQWAEREQVSFNLSRAYTVLDPGDVVSLDGKLMRLTDLRSGNGLVIADAVSIDGASLSASNTLASGSQGFSRSSGSEVMSILFLMDLPLLRNADDQPGFYTAVSGIDGWRGAALFKSADGTSYSVNTSFTLPALCGVAANALPSSPACYIDRVNTVTVGLLRGALASCSEIDLLNGANAALLGDEIIQFQNAVLNSDGSYTLRNILRARRGTEDALATHVGGERFVLLSNETMQFLPLSLTDRGQSYDFRAVSTGQDMDEVADSVLTPQLKTIRPFAPAHVTGTRNGSGDLTVNWIRRARKNSEWMDLVDVPLDEDTELYDMEILNGVTVVRSFSSLASPMATYTAAQQVSDFGSAQASVSVKVYQLSSRYGRGVAAARSV